MVLHGRIIRGVIERTGAALIPKGYRAFQKYDKQLYRQAFGPTGGKAVRHGRDAGLAIGGVLRDELSFPKESSPTSRPFDKAYRRRGVSRGYQRGNKYSTYTKCRCPHPRKYPANRNR